MTESAPAKPDMRDLKAAVGDVLMCWGYVEAAKGFSWGCQHDSCKSAARDRLDQIKKAISEGWFAVDALMAFIPVTGPVETRPPSLHERG